VAVDVVAVLGLDGTRGADGGVGGVT